MSFYDTHGRLILMVLNIIYMAGAVLCLFIGIWFAIAIHIVFGIILIVVAILNFLLNFYGYRGAHTRNAAILKRYGWILLILTILAVIGAIVNLIKGNDNPDAEEMERYVNIISWINIMIQILCIVLTYGLYKAISG